MIKIFSVAVIGAVSFVLLKKYSPEFTVIFEIGAVVFLIFFIYPYLCDLIDLIKTYGADSGVNAEYINIIVKALGISLVTQFSSDMCKDAGETALASKHLPVPLSYVPCHHFPRSQQVHKLLPKDSAL